MRVVIDTWLRAKIELAVVDMLVSVIQLGCSIVPANERDEIVRAFEANRDRIWVFMDMPQFNGKRGKNNPVYSLISRNLGTWWEIACEVYSRQREYDYRFVNLASFEFDKSGWTNDAPWGLKSLMNYSIAELSGDIYSNCAELVHAAYEKYRKEYPEEVRADA